MTSDFFCECPDSGEPPCFGLVQLREQLAAAQEARQRAEERAENMANWAAQEGALRDRAEALAESYRQDAERYRWLRDAPQDKIVVEAPDGEGNTFYAWGADLDAAIDQARKP